MECGNGRSFQGEIVDTTLENWLRTAESATDVAGVEALYRSFQKALQDQERDPTTGVPQVVIVPNKKALHSQGSYYHKRRRSLRNRILQVEKLREVSPEDLMLKEEEKDLRATLTALNGSIRRERAQAQLAREAKIWSKVCVSHDVRDDNTFWNLLHFVQ